MSWLVQYRGRILGPISDRQIISSIQKGELLKEHKVSSTKNPQWKNLGDYNEFKPHFTPLYPPAEILPPKVFLFRKNLLKEEAQLQETTRDEVVEESMKEHFKQFETSSESVQEGSLSVEDAPIIEEQKEMSSPPKPKLEPEIEMIFSLNLDASKTEKRNSLFHYLQTQIDQFDKEEFDKEEKEMPMQTEQQTTEETIDFEEYIEAIEKVRIRKEEKPVEQSKKLEPPTRPSISTMTYTLEEKIPLREKRKIPNQKMLVAIGVSLVFILLGFFIWNKKMRGPKDFRLPDPSSPTAEQALFEDDPIPQLRAPTRPERD